jgi:phosphoribosylformylglycinamidine synthase
MPRDLGFDITCPAEIRKDAFLFGESQGRIVVSVTESKETDFIDFMMNLKVPFSALGHVTKGELRIDDLSYGFISDVKKSYFSALDKILEA